MSLPDTEPIAVVAVEVAVYRAPIDNPVVNAMGTMTDRPAVVVRLQDRDGGEGFGEIWCNFPTCGAEHRARLVRTFLAPLLTAEVWTSPRQAFERLSLGAHRLSLQAGEPGPMAQAIAGIDIALWDLAARRAGQPLWRFLGGAGKSQVPAYASGINPNSALAQAEAARASGFRAFKLKIGFGRERDLANLRSLRKGLGAGAPIAVDANQAWDLEEARRMSRALAPLRPMWLEEPLPADRPAMEWQALASSTALALAAGENLRAEPAFDEAIAGGALAVIQPDLCKWGGVSGCLPVARRIRAAGRRYCPHFLGGGLGLLASAHVLAAVGGDGLLEVDCNPNPLREGLAKPFPALVDGHLMLGDAPGLGVRPCTEVEHYRVA